MVSMTTLSIDATVMISKIYPIIGKHVGVNRLPWQQYDLLKTSLILALNAYN